MEKMQLVGDKFGLPADVLCYMHDQWREEALATCKAHTVVDNIKAKMHAAPGGSTVQAGYRDWLDRATKSDLDYYDLCLPYEVGDHYGFIPSADSADLPLPTKFLPEIKQQVEKEKEIKAWCKNFREHMFDHCTSEGVYPYANEEEEIAMQNKSTQPDYFRQIEHWVVIMLERHVNVRGCDMSIAQVKAHLQNCPNGHEEIRKDKIGRNRKKYIHDGYQSGWHYDPAWLQIVYDGAVRKHSTSIALKNKAQSVAQPNFPMAHLARAERYEKREIRKKSLIPTTTVLPTVNRGDVTKRNDFKLPEAISLFDKKAVQEAIRSRYLALKATKQLRRGNYMTMVLKGDEKKEDAVVGTLTGPNLAVLMNRLKQAIDDIEQKYDEGADLTVESISIYVRTSNSENGAASSKSRAHMTETFLIPAEYNTQENCFYMAVVMLRDREAFLKSYADFLEGTAQFPDYCHRAACLKHDFVKNHDVRTTSVNNEAIQMHVDHSKPKRSLILYNSQFIEQERFDPVCDRKYRKQILARPPEAIQRSQNHYRPLFRWDEMNPELANRIRNALISKSSQFTKYNKQLVVWMKNATKYELARHVTCADQRKMLETCWKELVDSIERSERFLTSTEDCDEYLSTQRDYMRDIFKNVLSKAPFDKFSDSSVEQPILIKKNPAHMISSTRDRRFVSYDIESSQSRGHGDELVTIPTGHKAYMLGMAWYSSEFNDETNAMRELIRTQGSIEYDPKPNGDQGEMFYIKFEGLDCLVDFMVFIVRWQCYFRGASFYAHNGGKFDLLLIMREAFLSGQISTYDMELLGDQCVCVNGRWLKFDVQFHEDRKNKISFKDSLALLPGSLDSLCKDYRCPHQKLTETVSHDQISIDNWSTFEELPKYLKHDVLGLLELVDRASESNWDISYQTIVEENKSEVYCANLIEWLLELPHGTLQKAWPSWLKPKPNELSQPELVKGTKIKPLELDGYSVEHAIAFEFQGPQHYDRKHWINRNKTDEEWKRDQEKDSFKVRKCAQNNVDLIVIPYDSDWAKEIVQQLKYQYGRIDPSVMYKDKLPGDDVLRRDRVLAEGALNLTKCVSASSVAKKLFFSKYYNQKRYPIYCNTAAQDDYIRSDSYFGGRVELYHMGLLPDSQFYQDFTSHYPAMGATNDFPYDRPKEFNFRSKDGQLPTMLPDEFFGFARCLVQSTELGLTCKPLHGKKGNGSGGQLLFAHLGKGGTWVEMKLFSEEIRLGQKKGLYRYKFIDGLGYKRAPILKDVFEGLFAEKCKAKLEGKFAKEKSTKVYINSVYGFFGIVVKNRETMKIYKSDDVPVYDYIAKNTLLEECNHGDYTTLRVEDDLPIQDFNVAIAAAVTSYGRMYLWEMMNDCEQDGGMVSSCDTDSQCSNYDMARHRDLFGRCLKDLNLTNKAGEKCRDLLDKYVPDWNAGFDWYDSCINNDPREPTPWYDVKGSHAYNQGAQLGSLKCECSDELRKILKKKIAKLEPVPKDGQPLTGKCYLTETPAELSLDVRRSVLLNVTMARLNGSLYGRSIPFNEMVNSALKFYSLAYKNSIRIPVYRLEDHAYDVIKNGVLKHGVENVTERMLKNLLVAQDLYMNREEIRKRTFEAIRFIRRKTATEYLCLDFTLVKSKGFSKGSFTHDDLKSMHGDNPQTLSEENQTQFRFGLASYGEENMSSVKTLKVKKTVKAKYSKATVDYKKGTVVPFHLKGNDSTELTPEDKLKSSYADVRREYFNEDNLITLTALLKTVKTRRVAAKARCQMNAEERQEDNIRLFKEYVQGLVKKVEHDENGKAFLTVCYARKECGGRRYSVGEKDNGHVTAYSLQGMYGSLRRYLIQDRAHDVDIENCIPTLLSQIAHEDDVPAEYTAQLDYYVARRAEVIRDIAIHHLCTAEEYDGFKAEEKNLSTPPERKAEVKELLGRYKDIAKDGVIRVYNGGTLKKWLSDHGIKKNRSNPSSFLVKLQEQIQSMREFMLALPKYQIIRQSCKKLGSDGRVDKGASDRSAFATITFKREDEVLQAIEESVNKDGWHTETLIYDGIPLYHRDDLDLNQTMRNAEIHVKKSIGIDVKLLEKPMYQEGLTAEQVINLVKHR